MKDFQGDEIQEGDVVAKFRPKWEALLPNIGDGYDTQTLVRVDFVSEGYLEGEYISKNALHIADLRVKETRPRHIVIVARAD